MLKQIWRWSLGLTAVLSSQALAGEKIVQLPAMIQTFDASTGIGYSGLHKTDIGVSGVSLSYTYNLKTGKLDAFSFPKVNNLKELLEKEKGFGTNPFYFSNTHQFITLNSPFGDAIYQWNNGDARLAYKFAGYDYSQVRFSPDDRYAIFASVCGLEIRETKTWTLVLKSTTEQVCDWDSPYAPDPSADFVMSSDHKRAIFLSSHSGYATYTGFLNIDLNHPIKFLSELEKGRYGEFLKEIPYAQGSYALNKSGNLVAIGSTYSNYLNAAPSQISSKKVFNGAVLDFKNGRIMYRLTGQSIGIFRTAFSPNDKYLVTWGDDYNSQASACINNLAKPNDPYGDPTIALRDARNGKIIKLYKHACTGPFFTADSKKLLFSDLKNRLHIVDVP